MNQRFPFKVDNVRASRLAAAVAAAGIFVATVLLVMLLQEAPLKQTWIYALCGLTILVPYGVWLTVLLHYDPSPPRPQDLMVSALAWGSLVSFAAAIVLEDVFVAIDASLGVPNLDTMVVAPLWEEFTKGLFIVLLYAYARRRLRGPWDGLVYGALVGTGFGFAEDIAYLNSSLSDDGFGGLVATYVVREIFTAHAHPMFTAATGLAAGMAARQRLSPGRALRWIFRGFLIAFILHAIFDSATVLASYAVFFIAPAYGALFVIALRWLHRREIVEKVHRHSTDID
ncbi:PrsW family intramembrane metalloprotease [Chelativorans sp. M5D2P16]|uniref:PrsW family intramembrane metalloprotease n=1 Tax=Chelativorans sp. M5D2P16 TaxID=3095678 RepID=UPI002ACAD0D8|nr:PrsW family intramembrane metalloprotease [Chelativorans sp. M5D2P16]MDZ5698552.1 PrsW family intramembrane metalloprotease [Chelativorans sp. M5D2P16]